ncbi:MAG: hypothetical protein IKG74_02585 [Firmicutes bacterium]|nr:hypothetical protein [Bacillota bacterium]
MKKILLPLAALMLLFALAACGGAPEPAEPGELATLADALSVESDLSQLSMDGEHFVYVFDYYGTPTRVVANMTEELYEAASDVFMNDDSDEKLLEIVGQLPLESVEDLTLNIPDQAELDKLIGKTGQELLDEGYEIWGYYSDGEELYFNLEKGDYAYLATFNEDTPIKETSSYQDNMSFRTLKSLVYEGIGSGATDIFRQ